MHSQDYILSNFPSEALMADQPEMARKDRKMDFDFFDEWQFKNWEIRKSTQKKKKIWVSASWCYLLTVSRTMASKIKVDNPVVEMDGDEMTRYV